jgi:hypothetical protein
MHYCLKVWGHLEMSLFLKHLKVHQIDQKYSVAIVNVVMTCSWKQLLKKPEYLHRCTEAHYQQPSLVFQWHVVLANPC